MIISHGSSVFIMSEWISNHMPGKACDKITYPILNFNSCTNEVWEWIPNFIPHIIMDVIIYPCWGYNYSILIIMAPVGCLLAQKACNTTLRWHFLPTKGWFHIKMVSYQFSFHISNPLAGMIWTKITFTYDIDYLNIFNFISGNTISISELYLYVFNLRQLGA